ncbi:ABC transporter ATP-binding protein [Paenibacillus sp. MMS20-IR301]|uniref:ABC transporter ATP-binding protein n=1 Tax=Paenibacillus sp. MMS20-IR301 TaxID=2895946 RepID=UPI0028E7C934|nr:ABC transporter ATP-binding protein [Paenibacillus sp. MMS20-IR301]WNS42752.1 ABC transporter ATP-binding protein [Paenibacillus sp. MMS20-IR301]
MLQIHGLKKQFKVDGRAVPILDIPQWNVRKGEHVAITGPSGSGKSTLLHLISGIMGADSGSIVVGGTALHEMTEAKRDAFRASAIGYVLQDFHLIPSLTARQNIEIAMTSRLAHKERRQIVDGWLEQVGLEGRAQHLPSQLSRGQQQRVAIVRALINHPPLLLADEPTGSLDWETADEISSLLLELSITQGHTLIVVTHDLNMANRFPRCLNIQDINGIRREPLSGSMLQRRHVIQEEVTL